MKDPITFKNESLSQGYDFFDRRIRLLSKGSDGKVDEATPFEWFMGSQRLSQREMCGTRTIWDKSLFPYAAFCTN